MNLKDIRKMIGSILDYDPEVSTYKSEVNRVVNEVIDDLVSMHPWMWSQSELDQYSMPDVDLGTVSLVNSSVIPINFIPNTANLLTHRHEGSILTITNAADTRDDGEYIIDKVDFDSVNNNTYLSKLAKLPNRLAGWHTSTSSAQATVLQRYLPLPYDCAEPLSIGIRNQPESGTDGYRHFYQLTRRHDEELNLRLDIVGQPTEWIPYSNFPEKVLTVADFPAFSSDLTISEVATLGTPWPQGIYEFKFCYVWRGQEGPLSEAQEFTVVNPNSNLRFITRDTTLGLQRGIRKKIYVRLKAVSAGIGITYSDEHFRDLSATILPDDNYYVMNGFLGSVNIPYVIIDDDLVTFDYPNTTVGLVPSLPYLKSLPRAPDNDGHVWMIRLNPHPSGVVTPLAAILPTIAPPDPEQNIGRSASNAFVGVPIRIRYNKRFYILANDIDTPQMPPDVHRYIVYASCVELFQKHKEQQQALFYQKKTANELSGVRKRWLTTRAGPYIKAAFNVGPIYGEAFRKLTYKP